MNIYKAVDNLDDNQIDKISVIIEGKPEPKPDAATQPVEELKEEAEEAEEQQDQVNEMAEDKLTSVSQQKPTFSQISGRTYISDLQKQLQEERDARVRLEADLEELKKISSEITSQLSAMQKEQEK